MINNASKMMSIKQVAQTGLLPKHALRQMAKQGKLPAIYIGNKCLVNYDLLIKQLNSLGSGNKEIK